MLSFWTGLKCCRLEKGQTDNNQENNFLLFIDIEWRGSFTEKYDRIAVSVEQDQTSVYLSSLRVSHLSDAPKRRLVVMRDSARIQDETTESST